MTVSVTFSITDTKCTLSGIKTAYVIIGPLGFCGGSHYTQIDVLLTAYALTFQVLGNKINSYKVNYKLQEADQGSYM